MKLSYKHTVYACFIGYVVQAIVNNFAPLLFLNFQTEYGIPLSKITMLVTVNFGVQLVIDLLSVKFVDKLGYRKSMIAAHIFAAAGIVLMTVLPDVLPDAFAGLLTAAAVYAVGGGLLETVVSPVVEACPTDNKERAMSLLHSFYCWGHVGVVLVTTIFFEIFGISAWKILALIWASVPLFNIFLFMKVPFCTLIDSGERGLSVKELFSKKVFWIFMILMVCAGASEQAVSQWASTLAEKGLGVGKTVGDLAGPMSFAVLMGLSRAFYGKCGDRINLERFMLFSGILCVLSYLCIALIQSPVFGLIGCALCGLSVGIMWPGTFSKASAAIRRGGTAMFALLALAGDIGCSGGPTFAGIMAGFFDDDLRKGILCAIIFPVLLIIMLCAAKSGKNN